PNGTIPGRWQPTTAGADWEMTPSLEPLADLRKDFSIFTGLAQHNAKSLGDGAGDHARSAASFLTGAHPVKTDGANIRVGKSIDQFAAEHLGRETRLPSIELGTEAGRNAGSCDSGYSCAYSNSISWKSPTQPMAKEINPRLAFERLFGNGGGSGAAREKRMFYRKSILDMVAADAAELKKSVGQNDRQKLDEYFTSVREIEQRIERLRHAPKIAPPDFTTPEQPPKDTREHIRLMFDLMVLAFQSDVTRIATFMLANEGSNRTYPMVGVSDAHHGLSHHQNDKEKIEKIAQIDRFFVEEFAYFLKRLRETKDGEKNLLDNSLVLYGCAIGDGNRHNHDQLPIILAGRGGGKVRPGRHIKLEHETPLNNLFLSMVGTAGLEAKEFGDSTGPLKGLDG
ncbi:MAG: DUF1552 domain-containing protein, partial [Planctomycetota bacterium]|nr:DUF1552 domain-containing protein [Planctomycetota bacterium]